MATNEPEQPYKEAGNVRRGKEGLSSYMNYTGKQLLCKDISITPNHNGANGQSWMREMVKSVLGKYGFVRDVAW